MEKLLIYAAIGVAYWAYKALFKNFGTSTTSNKPTPLPAQEPYKVPEREFRNFPSPQNNIPGTSLFDLLEEINKQEKAPASKIKVKEEPKKYFTLEDTDYEAEKVKAPIEDVDPYAYAPKKITVFASNTPSQLPDFSTQRPAHPLLALLKDKNKVKEAFIAGEILAKKY